MAIDLLRSVVDQIQVGAPLPFGVRDEQGQLLLAKGRVVANESQRQILIERGLYVDHDEAASDEEAAGADGAKRKTTLFDLWKQATAWLGPLRNRIDKPGFANRKMRMRLPPERLHGLVE